ncbi:MAG TPA: glutamate--tRNA ligase family protein, partial [Tepidiformaceae bacterium]|nr:glutamate--tRNA ligase family protein [Tepidiformaceae bacterium]
VVVDDTEMEISHAIRGDEWISSAPKHIQLYAALGYEPPVWAHLPLILGPDHKKLSKRSGDTAVLDYAKNGYLPEAMVNFLAFLGWSLDDHTSLVTIDELKQHFDLARVVPNPAVFDVERLNFLNGHYIRQMTEDRWNQTIVEWAGQPMDADLAAAVAPLLRDRVARLDEIAPMTAFLFSDNAPHYAPGLLTEKLAGDAALARRVLESAATRLGAIEATAWDKESVEVAVRGIESEVALKLRKFISVLYTAIEGSPQGLPLFDSIAILGRSRTLHRLGRALAVLP